MIIGGGVVLHLYFYALVQQLIRAMVVDAVLQVNKAAYLRLWQSDRAEA